MATKNNRRVLITKRILKESLLALMQEKSIYKISIKEICDLSEMSRSTFYLHYQDQYELLKDIENDVLENTFEALNNLEDKGNVLEGIEKFLSYIKLNKDTFGVLLCQSENEDFQNAIMDKISGHVKKSIPELWKNEDEKYLFTFIMHGSLNVLRSWIKNDFDSPTQDLTRLLFNSCNNIVSINLVNDTRQV